MEPSYASGTSSTPLLGDTIGDNLDRTIARETLFLSEAFNRIRNAVWLSVRRQSISASQPDAAG